MLPFAGCQKKAEEAKKTVGSLWESPFDPYQHQYDCWNTLLHESKEIDGEQKPMSICVTTGTGSGKTECFMMPLVYDLANNFQQGQIQAIFLYPLNALMEDQKERLEKMLENTVNGPGTLSAQSWKFDYKTDKGQKYTIHAGGKTGTTQNWADAWTVGFTPFNTSAFWFGFDKPGQSLGLKITGATLAGFAWGDYMREIHRGLPAKDFNKPAEGVIQVTVCSVSGKIATPECGKHVTTQWILEGTQPTDICPVHGGKTSNSSALGIFRLKNEMYQSGARSIRTFEKTPLKLNLDFLRVVEVNSPEKENQNAKIQQKEENTPLPDYNYLME